MKKIILFIIVSLMLTSASFSQVKVTFALGNWGWDAGGIWYLKVYAIIPAGQSWRVGSSNIRVDFYTTPTGKLTVHPDGPPDSVRSTLACINSGNYSPMTTTSINGGTAISLNITHTPGTPCCTLTPGTYCLAKIRFNKIDSCCSTDTVRHSGSGSSPIYDSLTLLTSAQWSVQNPPPCTIVGSSNYAVDLPTVFKLYDNYPNPFNPTTTIKYDVPKASYVKLIIYDILGKTVSTLVNEKKDAGRYEVQWNANNFASGAYFYKMETDVFTDVKKMMLVK